MKFKSDIEIQAGVEAGGSTGSNGQVLSSTGSGVAWIDQNAITSATDFVFFNVKNETGSTIFKGKGVMAVGTDGNSGHILVDEMVADGTVESKYFLGVLEEDIANGAFARVISFGQLDQFNTNGQNGETWADGQVLWCDPVNPGDFTITEPDGPNVKIAAAFILNKATNGKIQVRVQANEGVHDLHDTKITSQVDGDVLVWDNTTGVWFNDSTLNVDYTNGRVGIGTTNPEAKLHVVGNTVLVDAGASSNYSKILGNAAEVLIGRTTTNGIKLYVGSSNQHQIQVLGNFPLDYYINGAFHTRFSNDGNVGIGTTSPGAKLEVSTDAEVVAKFAGNTDDGTGYVGAVVEIESNNDARGRGVYLTHRLTTDTSDSEWYAGVPYIGGGYSIGNAAYGTSINSDTGPAHKDQSKLFITEAGNVGIGTTSPGAKLEVNGDVTASGASTFASAILTGATTYLRPNTNGTQTLNIGGNGAGIVDWNQVRVYTNGSNDFLWNQEIVATQDWVTSQIETVDTLQEVTDNGSTTSNTIQVTGNNGTVTGNGAGVELRYITSDDVGSLLSYDRDSSLYKPLKLNGSEVALRVATTDILTATSTEVDITGNLDVSGTGTFGGNVTANVNAIVEYLGDQTQYTYYGVQFDRAASYIRPTTTNTVNLYIGGSSKGGADYNSINVYTDGTNDFEWNDEVIATQTWVSDNFSELVGDNVAFTNIDNNFTTKQTIANSAPALALKDVEITGTTTNGIYGAIQFTNNDNYLAGLLDFSGDNIRLWSRNGKIDLRTNTDINGNLDISGNIEFGTLSKSLRWNLYYDSSFKPYVDGHGFAITQGGTNGNTLYFGGTTSSGTANTNIGVSNFIALNGGGNKVDIYKDLDITGNVSIGGNTNSPYKLSISSSSSSQLELINSNNNKSWRPNVNGNDFYITETGVGNPFVIQAGGNVGIGTTSPSTKLDVVGDFGIQGILFWNTGTGTTGGSGVANGFSIPYRTSVTALNTAYNYRVRLTTTGTGTNSGSCWLVGYNKETTTWFVRMVSQSGNTSNHPLLAISSGNNAMVAYTNHASSYPIRWSCETIGISDNDGTLHNMGADFQWQRNIDNLVYSDGNVGIGTTSPSYKLEVSGNAALSLGADRYLRIGSSTNYWWDLQSVSNDFTLKEAGSNTRLIVKAGGNVGIGTTSPLSKLHVVSGEISNGANKGIRIENFNGTKDYSIRTGISGLENTSLAFYDETAGVNRMVIKSNGNVGIGTTSPVVKLQVDGTITSTGVLTAYTSVPSINIGHNGDSAFIAATSGGGANTPISFSVGNNNEKMRITSDGKVGIGTTSPSAKLDVEGRVDFSNDLRLRGTDSSANQGVTRFYVDSSNKLFIDTANDGSNLFVIDSSGNVGIGTTNPSAKLDVIGNASIGSTANNNGGSSYNLRLDALDTSSIGFHDSGSTIGAITFSAAQGGFILGANHASYGPHKVRTASDFIVDGNVGIGTTSPNEKLDVRGKLYIESQGVDWNESTPGTVRGALHFDPVGNGADNTGNAITFGASDTSVGTNAQAGIYTRSDGSYGTKMYFATTDLYITGSKTRMMIDYNGNVGIGTTSPQSKLQVDGGVQMADDTDTASAGKVGTLRYRTSGNNSYVDMCMQTGASTYEWVNIVQNNW